MDKINFNTLDNFPFSIKTADKLQGIMTLLSNLTALGGSNYILQGCEDVSGVISNGYMVIAGELLPFVGGAAKPYVTIVETREDASAFGIAYPDAYINRIIELTDTPAIAWNSLVRLMSNIELAQKIDQIKGDPPGIRVSWCGTLDKLPANYMLCDGRTLNKTEYPELFDNIGFAFGSVGTTQFKLPDLREKFVVGYSGSGDYNKIGDTGGSETVTLTEAQMAEHDHTNDAFFNKLSARAADVDATNTPGSVDSITPEAEYRVGGMSALQWNNATIKKIGNNDSHENRPPFFVEAFIIKVKY